MSSESSTFTRKKRTASLTLCRQTYPDRDTLDPSIIQGWEHLKEAFPGRVLVVSNGAGSRKDQGAVAAESVARQLRVPVLVHTRAKPGCSQEILDYFKGKLPIHTVSDRRRLQRLDTRVKIAIADAVNQDFDRQDTLLGRSKLVRGTRPQDKGKARDNGDDQPETIESRERQLHILVVGDRLATDVLLSRRLAKLLPATSSLPRHPEDIPSTLSIVTTHLFKHRDVRFLRWLEASWAKLGDRLLTPEQLGTRAGWERFLLVHREGQDGVDSMDRPTVPKRLFTILKRTSIGVWGGLCRVPGFIRSVPMRIEAVRKWRPPTWRQILERMQQAVLRGLKRLGPATLKYTKRGASLVSTKTRGFVLDRVAKSSSSPRLRAMATQQLQSLPSLQQRRGFNSWGIVRKDGKRAPSSQKSTIDRPLAKLHQPRIRHYPESLIGRSSRPPRYQTFPDDPDYSQFSASVDKFPITATTPHAVRSFDPLADLTDEDIIVVLEQVIELSKSNDSKDQSGVSMKAILLSIRARSTYGDILKLIKPRSMATMVTSLQASGAIHLTQLLLEDIAIRRDISDKVKIAVLRACAHVEHGEEPSNLDKSYLALLTSSVGDRELGLIEETRPASRDGKALATTSFETQSEAATKLEALLQGYIEEPELRQSDPARVYKTLYTYVIHHLGLPMFSSYHASTRREDSQRRERAAKILVYRVLETMVARRQVINATKLVGVLTEAGWYDGSVFQHVQSKGPFVLDTTALLIYCGLVRAALDIQNFNHAWTIFQTASQLASQLVGHDENSQVLAYWNSTFNKLARLCIVSADPQVQKLLLSVFLGPDLCESGLRLDPRIIEGYYTFDRNRQHLTNVWKVYRRLSQQGYPPPTDNATILVLLRALGQGRLTLSEHKMGTLLQAVQQYHILHESQYAEFIASLARQTGHQWAREMYENVVSSNSGLSPDTVRSVVGNGRVMHNLVKKYASPRRSSNATTTLAQENGDDNKMTTCQQDGGDSTMDLPFARRVIEAFCNSTNDEQMSPLNLDQLARCWIMTGQTQRALEVFQRHQNMFMLVPEEQVDALQQFRIALRLHVRQQRAQQRQQKKQQARRRSGRDSIPQQQQEQQPSQDSPCVTDQPRITRTARLEKEQEMDQLIDRLCHGRPLAAPLFAQFLLNEVRRRSIHNHSINIHQEQDPTHNENAQESQEQQQPDPTKSETRVRPMPVAILTLAQKERLVYALNSARRSGIAFPIMDSTGNLGTQDGSGSHDGRAYEKQVINEIKHLPTVATSRRGHDAFVSKSLGGKKSTRTKFPPKIPGRRRRMVYD